MIFLLSATQAMLDIGGNSGEFALQISRRHPHISATVIDLPVVCEVGREHVAAENPSASIQFMAADALSAALPTQQCLVTFKSILHDWPEPAVEQFFRQAHRSLRSGGRVLIFERAQLDPETQGVPDYGDLSTFLFYRSYRQAQIYQERLQAAGFTEIELVSVQLETPFHLITATKP